jgi:uncharacterized protein (TIGR03435 family)
MKRLWITLLLGASLASAADPAFEVVSIKPAGPMDPARLLSGKAQIGMKFEQGRVTIGYLSLRDLLPLAYEVKAYQISGPDWLREQRYDIVATVPEGATKEQLPAMLRAMLSERFHVEAHKETRDQNVYALTISKNGHKMPEAAPEPEAPPAPGQKSDMTIGVGDNQVSINRSNSGVVVRDPRAGTTKVAMGPNGTLRMEMARMTMQTLAETLTPMVDRPVINKTGLEGAFQVTLEMAMADMVQMARAAGMMTGAGGPPPGIGAGAPAVGGAPGGAVPALASSDPGSSSIFSAVQQLGLRLEGQKAPLDMIVVDKVDRSPTDN